MAALQLASQQLPSIISHMQYFRPVRLTESPDVWGPDKQGPTVHNFAIGSSK